jgi:hypothetical protein
MIFSILWIIKIKKKIEIENFKIFQNFLIKFNFDAYENFNRKIFQKDFAVTIFKNCQKKNQ